MHGEGGGARHGVQLGLDHVIDLLEGLLAQQPLQADGVGRLLVDAQHHLRGGDVGGQAMQRQQRAIGVLARVTHPFITAAGDQLVEALQPAQAIAARQLDEGRVHHFLHRRMPAQPHVTGYGLQHVHATGGHDGDLHGASVDLDQHDAFLPSAMQRLRGDGKGLGALHPQRLAGDGLIGRRLAGIQQDMIPGKGGAGGQHGTDAQSDCRGLHRV